MMPWVVFWVGAFVAVISGVFTVSPNGGSLLGIMMAGAGFLWIASRDVRDGL